MVPASTATREGPLVVQPRRLRSKDKIHKNRNSLVSILSGLQSQGKTIVLSNGVFDLLHVGHIRCLEDARSRGDFLLVAVNSDKSSQVLKGKGHPIVVMEERIEMLSAFWFVDYVLGFDEDTAEGLIRAFKPDLYAKGSEYTLRTLPERKVLREEGIKAVFVGDKKGHSSRKLIQRIRKKKFA